MKLLGNSVSIPVIEVLARAIIETGVSDEEGSIVALPHKGALEEMVWEKVAV